MKRSLLVSVVIPIYKTEPFLERCIYSVVNQTYRNLEIILVDDGSPDSCPMICNAWAAKDARIKVIHKENAGLGFARNTGIDNATGDYICFFDSDDYVESTTIEICCRSASETDADIICFGNDQVMQDGLVIETRIPTPPKYVFAGEEIRREVIPNLLQADEKTHKEWNLSLSACFSMISTDLIRRHNWRFVSERDIISEDFYSMFDLYRYVQKLVVLPDVFYHYTANPTSLSRTYRKDRYEQIVSFARAMLALSEQMASGKRLKYGVEKLYFGMLIGVLKQIVESRGAFSDKFAALREIIDDGFLQRVLRENDFSVENPAKRWLAWTMRRRCVLLCYAMVKMRNVKDKCSVLALRAMHLR